MVNQYCAHSFARNWQLPFLNQRKGKNDHRKYFMINLHERMLPTSAGVEPATSWSPTVPPRSALSMCTTNHLSGEKCANQEFVVHHMYMHVYINRYNRIFYRTYRRFLLTTCVLRWILSREIVPYAIWKQLNYVFVVVQPNKGLYRLPVHSTVHHSSVGQRRRHWLDLCGCR